jgi:hypothetical protein
MLIRFSMAALIAVLVAMGRPVPTGGDHDLLAVGVVVEQDGKSRTFMTVPTEEALHAYHLLLESPARNHLVHGGIRSLPVPESELTTLATSAGGNAGARVIEISFFGKRSRSDTSTIVFGDAVPDADAPRGMAETVRVARAVASLPASASSAAAQTVLRVADETAFTFALRTLQQSDPLVAASVARATALPPHGIPVPVERRVLAISVLKALGGRAVFPAEFRALEQDFEPLVRGAAR